MRTPRRWPRRKRTKKDGRTMSRQDRTNTDAIAAGWVAREDRGPLPAQERAQLQAWMDENRSHLGAYERDRAVFVHFDRARATGVQSGPVAGGPAGRDRTSTSLNSRPKYATRMTS